MDSSRARKSIERSPTRESRGIRPARANSSPAMKGTSTRSTPRRPFAGARVRDGSRSERYRQLESKPLPARSDDNEVLETV